MRTYTNSKNEEIVVSQEHLDVAVKIKKELQSASPSRKCNWSMHKALMEKEGFFDSDRSENYRQLIKSYQKSIGELPKLESYASMVSESKLASIKEFVGEIAYEKRSNQKVLSQLNKVKREIIDSSLVIEEITNVFKNINLNNTNIKSISTKESDRVMLVAPSDWHIGYLNDSYNHNEAKERIDLYIVKIVEYASIFGINKFHLIHLGDLVENLYMHKNTQSFNSEFTLAEQIVKATELLYEMIIKLSQVGQVVFHGVIRGNHGRMSAKGETVHNDCIEYVVHAGLKSLINLTNNPNIIVDDSRYNIERSMIPIKGKTVKAIHGDSDYQNDRDKIQKHISLENELIDVLLMGHFHNYQVKSENHGRLVCGSGCLQGSTEHGKSLKFANPASQGIIVFGEDEIIPINIVLE
jgi:predicted phosphodiesterase